MGVPTRYILNQGPVIGAIARAAVVALKSASGKGNEPPAEIPGPVVSASIAPRPADMVRDYIRHVGGDPAWYHGQLPAHMFPQWVFPLQAKGIEGLQYPIQRVLNGGSRLQMNAPLPLHQRFELRVQLLDVDDDGRRVVVHQRATMSTSAHPEAVIADVYGIVPLRGGDKSERRKDDRPRVPVIVKEVDRWKLSTHVGLDFAKLTGDFNPIHWIPLAARASGFRNVINHGFSTMARAVEGLNRSVFSGNVSMLESIDVQHRRPLVLPAEVGLYIDDDRVFVGDAPGGPAYMVGTYSVRS